MATANDAAKPDPDFPEADATTDASKGSTASSAAPGATVAAAPAAPAPEVAQAAEQVQAAPADGPVAGPKEIATAMDLSPAATVATIDLSNAIKSADTTSAQVVKAETQSVDMQTGAQIAHDNAVTVMVKRFEALCVHAGEEVAQEIKALLAKFHGAETVVQKAIADAGAE